MTLTMGTFQIIINPLFLLVISLVLFFVGYRIGKQVRYKKGIVKLNTSSKNRML